MKKAAKMLVKFVKVYLITVGALNIVARIVSGVKKRQARSALQEMIAEMQRTMEEREKAQAGVDFPKSTTELGDDLFSFFDSPEDGFTIDLDALESEDPQDWDFLDDEDDENLVDWEQFNIMYSEEDDPEDRD